MTELERELLATIERMNNHRDDQMQQATVELTTAVKELSQYLAAFTDALKAIVDFNTNLPHRQSLFERR
jgi:hypothetical protein